MKYPTLNVLFEYLISFQIIWTGNTPLCLIYSHKNNHIMLEAMYYLHDLFSYESLIGFLLPSFYRINHIETRHRGIFSCDSCTLFYR